MAAARGISSTAEEVRLVLLGKVGAGKSKVARLLLGTKEPKGEIGSCIIREGEAAGRRVYLVDTPGWDPRAINSTPEKIKNEIVRSVTLCPPGPHALIIVLRIESVSDGPSLKELKTVSRHMELLSQRVWKHTMVLFLCDKEVEENSVRVHIEKANKLLEKCNNRLYVLHSETQIPEFIEEVEKMVEGNCGDFFLPKIYYDYMQRNTPQNVAEMKKMYEEREEELKKQYQKRISEWKSQAEETALRQRRGSFQKIPPNLNEDDQAVATKTKHQDEKLPQLSLKPLALIVLTVIGALVGSVGGSAYGVIGSCVGIVIGVTVTIPLALWLINAITVAKDSSKILQDRKSSTYCEQPTDKRQ